MRLSLPLRLSAGRFVTVPTGSPQALAQSVALLLDTRPGERRSVPIYGMADPLFSGLDPQVIRSELAEWEPDAAQSAITIAVAGATQTGTVEVGLADEDFA